jgi:hypothetical protein
LVTFTPLALSSPNTGSSVPAENMCNQRRFVAFSAIRKNAALWPECQAALNVKCRSARSPAEPPACGQADVHESGGQLEPFLAVLREHVVGAEQVEAQADCTFLTATTTRPITSRNRMSRFMARSVANPSGG